MKPRIGDKVKVKRAVEANYSNYGINRGTVILLTPEITGTVVNVALPSIWRENVVFHNVDFVSPATGRVERAAVLGDNMVKVKR